MGPTRSDSNDAENKLKKHKQKRKDDSSASSLPGVQKIKSSLRQTRRLLAKDKLAADVRVDTERRLKSLESDLAKAERIRKERNFAVRYHKVKFFERQKVCRKIKHDKKELEDPETSPKNIASLRETLVLHRVDLNYILHYPKTKKYISLFPPQTSKGTNEAGNANTDRQREELRRWVMTAMEKGEMDAEPEVTMDKKHPHSGSMDWEDESALQPHAERELKQTGEKVGAGAAKGIPDDVFFEAFDSDRQISSGDG